MYLSKQLIIDLHISRYDGDLTIRLSSGLSIRVPNNQFLVPYVEIARNGTRVTNDTRIDFLLNGIGKNKTATLGRYFLTAAYLMVNHDANTFTLWQANPSTGSSSLVPIIEESTHQSCAGSSDGGGVTTTTPSSTATPDQPSSISIGAIVGGVVGGVVGLAGLAVAVFLIVRRRRKRLSAQSVEHLDNNTDEHPKPNVLTEMPHDSLPHEVEGPGLQPGAHQASGPRQSSFAARGPVYELDGHGQTS